MANVSWTPATTGLWGSTTNWSGSAVPGSSDVVFLNLNTAKYTAEVVGQQGTISALSQTASKSTLELSDGAGNGGTLNVTNTMTVTSGALLIDAAASDLIVNTLTYGAGGGLNISNGTLAVGGNFGLAQTTSGITDLWTGGVVTVGGSLIVNSPSLTLTDSGAATTVIGTANFTSAGIHDTFGASSGAGNSVNLGGLSVSGSGTVIGLNLGTVTVTNGTTISAATEISLGGGTLVSGSAGVSNAGTLFGHGLVKGSGSISGAGTVFASGGKLELGISDSSPLNIATGASNILKLDAAESNVTVTFGGATGVLELADFTAGSPNSLNFNTSTVASMGKFVSGSGDMINVQDTVKNAVVTGGNTLKISDSSGVVTSITLSGAGATTAAWFADGTLGGYDVVLVCYAAGTRIATPDGDAAVEDLAEGDTVLTLVDGDRHVPMPVKWVGHRRLDLTAHPRPDLAAPVRIRRGAFGQDLPHRDLVLSPDHCVFVDGRLIPAKLLINDMTIVQERDTRAVTYYHVELDRHAVLLAEGLPAESYLDTGNRAFFSNAGLALVLHPEFHVNAGLRCWDTDACAPLTVSADAVEPVWRDLADRAEFAGLPAARDRCHRGCRSASACRWAQLPSDRGGERTPRVRVARLRIGGPPRIAFGCAVRSGALPRRLAPTGRRRQPHRRSLGRWADRDPGRPSGFVARVARRGTRRCRAVALDRRQRPTAHRCGSRAADGRSACSSGDALSVGEGRAAASGGVAVRVRSRQVLRAANPSAAATIQRPTR